MESIKGYAASGAGFLAWAISRAEFDSWVGTLAGVGGLVLVVLTIVDKLRKWNRPPEER